MASIPIPRRYRTVMYIPSKNDGCMLEVCLSIPTTVNSQPTAYTGVVISHPYGPLGGSYNNNVVGAMLQWFETYPLHAKDQNNASSSNSGSSVPLACVICAFNFRGCGKSKGKTSWFGEAERDDYQTIIDFLQSGSHLGSSRLENAQQKPLSSTGTSPWNGKVYDETGREIDPPRLPFLSRFILSGYSYGGMIASTIPPPLRNPSSPKGAHLPTTYILISYPAGVGWFLTSGSQGSFSKRAKAILIGGKESSTPSSPSSQVPPSDDDAKAGARGKQESVEAYFITGTNDQFTSPKTLLSWLKTNAGLNPVKQEGPMSSWTMTRSDGAVHLDVVEGVDHFWLDREQEILDRLQKWWMETHPTSTPK
ncbi:hypothetical protein BGZ51_004486 [Haplosporangium sp. Z 767]|nr:hypothetical protein BGZ51_004486 [Haplosporangium sp. Z 767]KAF9185588.1 hypothetical protein BGZ50_002988 [Haplosporangium sp. Z 11]